MAYRCKKDPRRECDGCMDCQSEVIYYCPICGDEVLENVYVSTDGEVIGCENCVQVKDPEDVFDGET